MWVIAGAGLKGGEGDEGVITSGSGDEIEAPVKWAKVLTFRTKADAMTSRYLTNTASQKGRIARCSLEGGGGGGWGRLLVVVVSVGRFIRADVRTWSRQQQQDRSP